MYPLTDQTLEEGLTLDKAVFSSKRQLLGAGAQLGAVSNRSSWGGI